MLLRHKAEHDALTDLLNRASFDKLLKLHEDGDSHFALILVNVDRHRGGGTRTGEWMQLVSVSCVCGRTSSFPAGERNQRLPGAGEVSMRRAGPRTPL